jgi:hypothetical protein
MKSRQRRVRMVELSLTPQQIVRVWLRDAKASFTFEEAAQHKPRYRGFVANEVLHTVQRGMKGHSEAIVEQAITQARREADLLYSLAVNMNVEVIENGHQREREYIFLLGYLGAELRGKPTRNGIESLRVAILLFIDAVLVLNVAITKVESERFNGESILFRDCGVKLKEQLQMAERLSDHFNFLADEAGVAELNLATHRQRI